MSNACTASALLLRLRNREIASAARIGSESIISILHAFVLQVTDSFYQLSQSARLDRVFSFIIGEDIPATNAHAALLL